MARQPRDARIETRDARARLKVRAAPYWRQVHAGLAVGYYKGRRSGAWYLRRKRLAEDGGRAEYKTKKLGIADDHADGDGERVLSYAQAVKKAMAEASQTPTERREARRTEQRAGYTVADAVENYLEDLRARTRHGTTAEYTINRHILPRFGDRLVASLTTDEIRRWRNGLVQGKRKKSTANRILTVFKACLNFAYEHDKVESNRAWHRVKRFEKAENARIRYLQQVEAKRLLNACDVDFRPLVHAALLTGGRYGELAACRVQDFDPDAGTLYFGETKSGVGRHVPLTDEAVEHFSIWSAGKAAGVPLFARADGDPWATAHQIRRMRDACARARIDPPVTFHILRHTYGSLLALAGTPIKFIAEAMGHADTRMTERHYAHLQKDDAVAKAIRQNLPSFGRPDSKVRAL